jgi:hypothetical protein
MRTTFDLPGFAFVRDNAREGTVEYLHLKKNWMDLYSKAE